MRNKRGKLLGFMLTLALVIGLLPVMSLTVYADGEDITSNITITVADDCSDDNHTISNIFKNEYTVKEGVTITFECSKWWTNAVTIYLNGTAVATWAGYDYTSSYVWTAKKDAKLNWAGYNQNSANIYLTETDAVAVTGVTLDKESATLTVGGSETLTATVLPANATDKTVKWSVNNSNVALYSDQACTTAVGTDATDKLTVYAKGISAGSSTVTATSNADSEKKASCDVTVNAAEPESTYTITIPSTLTVQNAGWNALTGGISVDLTNFDGKKLVVTASSDNGFKFVKSEDTAQTVSYDFRASSTDITAITSWDFTASEKKNIGIVVENYSSKPAGTYNETVTFTAEIKIPVTSVTITNAPTEALFVNSTGTLTATVLPNDATDKTVTWSSDNPNHVKIDAATGEYTVTGVDGYGSATITATANDGSGVIATCTITGKVTYTSLSAGTVLHVGDTFYAGKAYFNTKPAMSFNDSNGVITLVEDNGCYKFKRGSNGTMPNVTAYKIKDNTDGVYIVSGGGTSTSDRFTLAVHTK